MSRYQKTLADYLMIAISPALIMLIVGSLVFFLQELSYRGNHPERMRWILFWVVFAFVLTSRIGIEQGREHARIYGLAIAVVTALAILRLADSFVITTVLLLIAWWCADKLTWDCTLLDDNDDASGTGLLDAAPPGASEPTAEPEGKPEPSKQKHAPGRTVLYFSLGALPLFGIGQVFIPANDSAARTYAFRLLWVYLAAALALLLSTSFLGLRRYLRQRRLEMPTNIVRSWIGTGAVLILLILGCCIFLPRPDADYSVASIGELVESTVRDASKIAFVKGDAGKNEGRRIEEAKNKGEANDEGRPQDEGEAKDKGEPRNSDDAEKNKAAGRPGEGNAKNVDEPDERKSDGEKEGAESKSVGQGGENDKSEAGKSSAENNENSKDKAAGDRERKDSPSKSEKGKGGEQQQKQQQDEQQQDEQGQGEQGQKGKQPDQKQADQKQDGAGAADEKRNGAKANAARPQQKAPTTPKTDLSEWLGSLAKWLFYAFLAIVVAWVLFRYWSQIVDAIAQLWTALLALFSGRKKKPTAPKAEAAPMVPVRPALPFAAFRSPFATGSADKMRVEDLIQYTFDALQAWANDRKLGRDPEQTPLEFSRALGARVPNFSREIDDTAQLYARVAYSGRQIPRSCLPVLEKLWRRMSSE